MAEPTVSKETKDKGYKTFFKRNVIPMQGWGKSLKALYLGNWDQAYSDKFTILSLLNAISIRVSEVVYSRSSRDPIRITAGGHRLTVFNNKQHVDSNDFANPVQKKIVLDANNWNRNRGKPFTTFVLFMGLPDQQKKEGLLTPLLVAKNFVGIGSPKWVRPFIFAKNVAKLFIIPLYSVIKLGTEYLPLALQTLAGHGIAWSYKKITRTQSSKTVKNMARIACGLSVVAFLIFKALYLAGRMVTSPLASLRAAWAAGHDDLGKKKGKAIGLLLVLFTLAAVVTSIVFLWPLIIPMAIALIAYISPAAAAFITSIGASILAFIAPATKLVGLGVVAALKPILGLFGAQIASSAASAIGTVIFEVWAVFAVSSVNYALSHGYTRLRNFFQEKSAPAVVKASSSSEGEVIKEDSSKSNDIGSSAMHAAKKQDDQKIPVESVGSHTSQSTPSSLAGSKSSNSSAPVPNTAKGKEIAAESGGVRPIPAPRKTQVSKSLGERPIPAPRKTRAAADINAPDTVVGSNQRYIFEFSPKQKPNHPGGVRVGATSLGGQPVLTTVPSQLSSTVSESTSRISESLAITPPTGTQQSGNQNVSIEGNRLIARAKGSNQRTEGLIKEADGAINQGNKDREVAKIIADRKTPMTAREIPSVVTGSYTSTVGFTSSAQGSTPK